MRAAVNAAGAIVAFLALCSALALAIDGEIGLAAGMFLGTLAFAAIWTWTVGYLREEGE